VSDLVAHHAYDLGANLNQSKVPLIGISKDLFFRFSTVARRKRAGMNGGGLGCRVTHCHQFLFP
jgi:hypothetical protein